MVAKLNLKINQGETYRHKLRWSDANDVPIDITEYEIRMQVREHVAATEVLLELITNPPIPDPPTGFEGSILLSDPVNGEFTLYLSDSDTSALTWVRGVYDLEMVPLVGDVIRLIEGTVTVSREITR